MVASLAIETVAISPLGPAIFIEENPPSIIQVSLLSGSILASCCISASEFGWKLLKRASIV